MGMFKYDIIVFGFKFSSGTKHVLVTSRNNHCVADDTCNRENNSVH